MRLHRLDKRRARTSNLALESLDARIAPTALVVPVAAPAPAPAAAVRLEVHATSTASAAHRTHIKAGTLHASAIHKHERAILVREQRLANAAARTAAASLQVNATPAVQIGKVVSVTNFGTGSAAAVERSQSLAQSVAQAPAQVPGSQMENIPGTSVPFGASIGQSTSGASSASGSQLLTTLSQDVEDLVNSAENGQLGSNVSTLLSNLKSQLGSSGLGSNTLNLQGLGTEVQSIINQVSQSLGANTGSLPISQSAQSPNLSSLLNTLLNELT